ncbi:hypothetical protein VSQ33_17530, partial [Escherichia coli]
DRNRSHWSTSKTPSYTKSVSWQHHLRGNRVKIPKEQDMPCTLQLTMIYVGITFFLIVGYICHQIT